MVLIYFDFAIFRNDLTDLIEPTFVSSATSQIQFQNVKEARIQGIEFSAKTFLFGLIGLESSVTLMDPVDLTLNQTLNYRSELLWYNRLFLPIEPFELQFDYRFKTKAQNVDRQLGLLIKDIDARVDMHVLDVRFIYNLDKIVKSDLRLILSARNVLDYYYTEMVGNLAPTRMIMLQLEAKF